MPNGQAIPDHTPDEFPDLAALNEATNAHALELQNLEARVADPLVVVPQEDFQRIDALRVHLAHHAAIRSQMPGPSPEEPSGGLLGPIYDFLRRMWDGITADLGVQLFDVTALTRVRFDQLGTQVADTIPASIAGAVISGQAGIAALLGQGLESFFRQSGRLIGVTLGSGATAFLEELERAFPAFGGGLFALLRDLPGLPDELRPLFQEAVQPTSQIAALIQQNATQAAISGTVGNAMGSLLAPVAFGLNRRFQFTHLDEATAIRGLFRLPDSSQFLTDELLDLGWNEGRRALLQELARPRPGPGDLRDLVNRGTIDAGTASQELRLQGWAADDSVNLIALRRQLLGPGDLRTLVNRGTISEAVATGTLQAQGLAPDDAQILIDLRRVLPGPTDIVRFAVREAFTPQIVRDFQLDSDFPADAVPLAERVGLASEDLLYYWRAHWELPSSTQAFEMLHRGVIDMDTLNTLLRTQDVMPFWRDKLVDIAYATLTRVDIRRFYRQRVLSLQDVIRRYQDIGYTDQDAQLQAAFVEAEDKDIAFNRALPEIRQQARLGLLEGLDLANQVAALAPDPATAEEAIETLALDIRGERLGQLLAAYRQALRAGRMSEESFLLAVGNLGISSSLGKHFIAVEAARSFEESDAREEVEFRAAGRASVVRRFREGLTTETQFASEMASLGYSQLETDRYLDVARLEFDTNYRLDLVAAALTAFRKEKLTDGQLRQRLGDLAIAPDLVDAYLERELARIRTVDPDPDQVALRASGSGAAIQRYREGWTAPEQFASEMSSLGYSELEIQRYQIIADLQFDYDWKQDALTNLRIGFRKDVVSADRFISDLAALGMDPSRAQTHLARETLAKGLLPAE